MLEELRQKNSFLLQEAVIQGNTEQVNIQQRIGNILAYDQCFLHMSMETALSILHQLQVENAQAVYIKTMSETATKKRDIE